MTLMVYCFTYTTTHDYNNTCGGNAVSWGASVTLGMGSDPSAIYWLRLRITSTFNQGASGPPASFQTQAP
jgi:hypothetical protein